MVRKSLPTTAPSRPNTRSRAAQSIRARGLALDFLPTEVLVRIYSALPSFAEVVHTAASCRRLNDIWVSRSNANIIFEAVAPRCIDCFEDAKALAATQCGGALKYMNLSAKGKGKRFKRNAARVERNLDYFNKVICHRWWKEPYTYKMFPHPTYLLPSERLRFFHAYYRCWILRESPQQTRESILESVDLPELGVWHDAILFVVLWCGNVEAPDHPDDGWRSVKDAIDIHRYKKANRDLGVAHPPPCPHVIHWPGPRDMPYGFWAFFDHFQFWIDELATRMAQHKRTSVGRACNA